jgi:hypothetical protein
MKGRMKEKERKKKKDKTIIKRFLKRGQVSSPLQMSPIWVAMKDLCLC